MLELFFNTKTTFSLLRGEWRENGSFVGDKYPMQSAGRMAKNGCDSFDLGPLKFGLKICAKLEQKLSRNFAARAFRRYRAKSRGGGLN